MLLNIKRYERHLSALSMIGGFAFDNYYFGRVDHYATQIVLAGYIMAAAFSILLGHWIESLATVSGTLRKIRSLLLTATQFAFGGLWSALLIFYWRSAVIAASWPFFAVLAVIFLGNEQFRRYRSRLAFTSTLLLFALFSYAIFAVPIFMGTMGPLIFIMSGALACFGFGLFLKALWTIGPRRARESRWGITIGAITVLGGLNFFYFVNILPPLPLALAKAGVFHSVMKDGDGYQVTAEPQSWYSLVFTAPVMHLRAGEPLSVYSAVFAPILLRTKIVHVWQHYDDARHSWRIESSVAFPITGGREGGYRGYSIKSNPSAGRWRVDIKTPDGRLIGRVAFSVAPLSSAVVETTELIK